MNHHVNAIAGRLSLRPPQRRSLEILDRITEIVLPKKEADVADDWPWSSCCRNEPADPCPVEVETDRLAHVDEPLSASQLASIRQSVNRQRPFGEPDWQTTVAGLFGLESTMRPWGRPALSEMRK